MNAEDAPLALGTALGDGLVEGRLTKSIIGCFYEVYNTLGFGFLERVYAEALTDELEMRGHHVGREVVTNVAYKGRIVAQFKLDRLVDDRVVLEIKSTQRLGKEDPRQLLNYLRATKWEVGLLLHFGPQPAFYRLISTNRDIRKGTESTK
jgi:GxxExxY protein